MSGWASQSQFHQNNKPTLTKDVRHSATALENSKSSAHVLHLVCGVLVTDTEAANASLPTPDAQSTRLLSRAYTDIGAGANICYGAGSSTSTAQFSARPTLEKASRTHRRHTARRRRPGHELERWLDARRSEIDFESKDAVFECGGGVTQHREVLKIESRGFKEHLRARDLRRAVYPFVSRLRRARENAGPSRVD
jgi:hypothetical protein